MILAKVEKVMVAVIGSYEVIADRYFGCSED
jgi:hypothetical protein